MTLDSAPEIEMNSEVDNFPLQKQRGKRTMFTPFKIAMGVALFFMIAVGSYKLYNIVVPNNEKSEIQIAHDLIIQVADSSKK